MRTISSKPAIGCLLCTMTGCSDAFSMSVEKTVPKESKPITSRRTFFSQVSTTAGLVASSAFLGVDLSHGIGCQCGECGTNQHSSGCSCPSCAGQLHEGGCTCPNCTGNVQNLAKAKEHGPGCACNSCNFFSFGPQPAFAYDDVKVGEAKSSPEAVAWDIQVRSQQ
mmetsp:Transcript_11385/g.10894  ORF Transcript_11385/g.10894 Transcript_11385/m.10894 type:complete len:166 (-) Transcript_11385:308-805(-)